MPKWIQFQFIYVILVKTSIQYLESAQFDDKLCATVLGEGGKLVQAEPELRARVPEAALVLRHLPREVVSWVAVLPAPLEHNPLALAELKCYLYETGNISFVCMKLILP